jgi:hypothetical protein
MVSLRAIVKALDVEPPKEALMKPKGEATIVTAADRSSRA